MVDEDDRARHQGDEFDHGAATGHHQGRLRAPDHPVGRMRRRLRVDGVPVRADGVEVGVEVESLVDEVDPGPLAHLHLECVVAGQGIGPSVEGDEPRLLVEQCVPVELGHAGGVGFADVPLRLADRPFVVHGRKGILGVDDDDAVHAPGDVLGHVAEGAVVHERAGVEQAGLDRLRFPRCGREIGGAAPLARDRMEVDVVRVLVAGEVGHGQSHHVADPPPDHRPGAAAHDGVVTGDPVAPHEGGHPVGGIERAHVLEHLEVDVEDPLIRSRGRGRYLRDVRDVGLGRIRGRQRDPRRERGDDRIRRSDRVGTGLGGRRADELVPEDGIVGCTGADQADGGQCGEHTPTADLAGLRLIVGRRGHRGSMLGFRHGRWRRPKATGSEVPR